MNRNYTISVTLPDNETVTREIRCESKEKAMSLMKAKFDDVVSLQFVSEREITVEDEVREESARVESNFLELDELERKHRQQKNRGLVVLAFGVVATIALYFYGWISWFTLLPIGAGIYEYSNGSWGVKRARRLKSWEMDTLES